MLDSIAFIISFTVYFLMLVGIPVFLAVSLLYRNPKLIRFALTGEMDTLLPPIAYIIAVLLFPLLYLLLGFRALVRFIKWLFQARV